MCDTLKACYLVDIQTRKETELQSNNKLELDPLNTEGYSIRCDSNGNNELHFIKFFYDGIVQDEYGLPRYMNGDSDNGAYINKVDYISTCGLKTFKIEGHVWDKICFENEYSIDVSNADGTSCDNKPPTNAPIKQPTMAPIKPPTMAPVKAPTNVPIKPPTMAPVKAPTNVPIKPPTKAPIKPATKAPIKPATKAPVKPPTKAPIKPPTKAPVKPPTKAPVKKSTKAPIKPATKAPVKPPTKAPIKPATKSPVKPPTRAPVAPPVKPVPVPTPVRSPVPQPVPVPVTSNCPYPKVWIDGCCQDTCINNYVCPDNSCRIEHRLCYDNFDDCQCKYGYYKSTFEDKCIRHSWCVW